MKAWPVTRRKKVDCISRGILCWMKVSPFLRPVDAIRSTWRTRPSGGPERVGEVVGPFLLRLRCSSLVLQVSVRTVFVALLVVAMHIFFPIQQLLSIWSLAPVLMVALLHATQTKGV